MARFIGYTLGNRGQASRLGTADSGIRSQAQGWTSGVTVLGSVDKDDRDVFQVIQNSGSNGSGDQREILRVVDGEVFVHCGNFSVPLNDLIRFGARPAVEARAAYDREHS